MAVPAETWLLPDGVHDILPAEAARLESLRRRLLDLFASWGYELVFPPLMEYLESLLTGAGHDLELMTFKITDQISGRLMGVRADITPQVARLDAHCLKRQHAARYCYSGVVLNTRPQGLASSRAPIQIGAELYGHAGVAADSEILNVMLTTLQQAGVPDIHLDLGHVAVFRELAKAAELSADLEAQLFDIYQRKSVPELTALLPHIAKASWFAALGSLSGGVEVLAQAQQLLADAPVTVHHALSDLATVVTLLQQQHPEVSISIDLAELRGYHYHTGLVFAAYAQHSTVEIAKGGRYDHIGEAFGRARPATGFSADLKAMLKFYQPTQQRVRIYAPANADVVVVAGLRAQGKCVVQALADDSSSALDLACQQQLLFVDGQWQVVAVA